MSELRVRRVLREHAAVQTSRLLIAGRPSLYLDYASPWGQCEGEAAPISGYGDDSLERAQEALEAWTAQRLDAEVEALFAKWGAGGQPVPAADWEQLHAGSPSSSSSPSARFAVDQVVAQAVSRRAGLPGYRVFSQRAVARRLATSQVLSALQPNEFARAARFLAEGVRTFKVKCGKQPKTELHFVREVASLGKDVRLRIDANGSFTSLDVGRFCDALGTQLEWIEDPTLDPTEWTQWPEAHWPLAVDEPLVGRSEAFGSPDLACAEMSADSAAGPFAAGSWGRRVRAVVLKPMALGGWAPCLRWAQAARSVGVRVCVSHFFDGPRAAWGYATLAFAVQSPEVAVGLSRHAGLAGAEGQLPWLTGDALLLGPLEDPGAA